MTVDTGPTGTTRRAPATASPPRRRRRNLTGLLFVLPFLLAYALFLGWPLVGGLISSLTDASLASDEARFVGLDNYAEAVGDPAVWQALWVTVKFTLLSTPLLVAVGLVMALLTNHLSPGRWLWRLAFFAPYVLPSTVVTMIFVWIFQPDFGLADGLLASLGIDADIGWLTEPNTAMMSVVLTTVWWTVGFNFLLYLAGLQAIPHHLYEAAELDGATWWDKLWRITLPMLRRTTGLVVVLQLLASLKIFDQFYLMTGGGPEHTTRPVIQYMYQTGFTNFRIGYASAISYILFALILVVAVAQIRLFRPREEAS
ncbi:sugar ABC transporter permease [Actinoalloteichus sp. AHMU CJ021]|uniref:Carbohydrate ABC transporter membrane protein 1, CUT1 family (TC 3.A.1.1.-) n=1 Tax=Actinoalloteichus caeruleus DSM 43889 TaxID=1120930 RepID=A0ABT1JQ28_ACTCY|nr:sugar ABC transporter permease [Actinoalloteichus caeruleus]AUS80363.1 sugar ABC transporter permease [Actinoalloteichus sp. AHMU CJ021]MCP2334623.1 carbohydrate ABC transporter membrane protein 1, CUT1 family (TC 3.A.1.1.-) [Actinoalloteichus caeruleus DSM 43889]